MVTTMITYHVRVTGLIQHLDVVQLKVQELVDTLQRALNGKAIFQLDRNCLTRKGLKS